MTRIRFPIFMQMAIAVMNAALVFTYIMTKEVSLAEDYFSSNLLIDSNSINRKTINSQLKKHDFSTAICSIVKDAEAYLQEWIDYNLLALEFDNIYIYDHSENFDLKRWYQNTRSHPEYSRVEIMHFNTSHYDEEEDFPQTVAYNLCMQTYGKQGPKHEYIFFIDYDEYLVFQEGGKHLETVHDLIGEYLHPFDYGGALAFNWMYFGSANRTVYSPVPVLKRFQYSDDKAMFMVKTMAKTSKFVEMNSPHAVILEENSTTLEPSTPGAKAKLSKIGASNRNIPSEVALLYHCRFMSDKEQIFKHCHRGNVDGVNRGCDEKTGKISAEGLSHHLRPRAGTKFNDKAWKFLTKKVPKYRLYDSDEYQDFF